MIILGHSIGFLNRFRWAIDLLDGFAEKIVGALGIVSPHKPHLVRSTEELQVMIQRPRSRLAAGGRSEIYSSR